MRHQRGTHARPWVMYEKFLYCIGISIFVLQSSYMTNQIHALACWILHVMACDLNLEIYPQHQNFCINSKVWKTTTHSQYRMECGDLWQFFKCISTTVFYHFIISDHSKTCFGLKFACRDNFILTCTGLWSDLGIDTQLQNFASNPRSHVWLVHSRCLMHHMSNCLEAGKVSVLLSCTRYIEFMILIMADPLALIMEGLERHFHLGYFYASILARCLQWESVISACICLTLAFVL